jgi:hypothetical protein
VKRDVNEYDIVLVIIPLKKREPPSTAWSLQISMIAPEYNTSLVEKGELCVLLNVGQGSVSTHEGKRQQ